MALVADSSKEVPSTIFRGANQQLMPWFSSSFRMASDIFLSFGELLTNTLWVIFLSFFFVISGVSP